MLTDMCRNHPMDFNRVSLSFKAITINAIRMDVYLPLPADSGVKKKAFAVAEIFR